MCSYLFPTCILMHLQQITFENKISQKEKLLAIMLATIYSTLLNSYTFIQRFSIFLHKQFSKLSATVQNCGMWERENFNSGHATRRPTLGRLPVPKIQISLHLGTDWYRSFLFSIKSSQHLFWRTINDPNPKVDYHVALPQGCSQVFV